MAWNTFLRFNEVDIPKPTNYNLSFRDVLSDSSGETEAGTTQRDVVRIGVATIDVAFQSSALWVNKFTAFSREIKLDVTYFDPLTVSLSTIEMYMTNYKVNLAHDTSYGCLWEVSFTLNEF